MWKSVRQGGKACVHCDACDTTFAPGLSRCSCSTVPSAEPATVAVEPDLRDLETVAGCRDELIRLLDYTEGGKVLRLSRDEVSGIAERRRQLTQLLSLAADKKTERLVTGNERLRADLGRQEKRKRGHAQRADTAVTPRSARN